MKLMDEVKLESSVEALEALCAPFHHHPDWPAIRQNLQALREVLRDATAGMQAQGGWRPIDTVPRDGREVILREGSRVGAACWVKWPDTYDNDGAPNNEGGEGWTVGYDGDEWRNPTGWQPMPSAAGATASSAPCSPEQAIAAWNRNAGVKGPEHG